MRNFLRPVLSTLSVVVVGLGLSACAGLVDSGPLRTEQRSIGPASAVRLLTSGDLHVDRGDRVSLTVNAGAKTMPHLTATTQGGTLVLDDDGTLVTGPISYRLTVPSLTFLEVAGSGDVTVVGAAADQLTLRMSGSGDASLPDIHVGQVDVDLSGSGNVTVSGSTVDQHIQVSGSGGYTAGSLAARVTDVESSGSGDATVTATDRVGITKRGSGDITVVGNPHLGKLGPAEPAF